MEQERTELLVIGAGPCGLAVGAAAREAGTPCVLVDKGPVVSAIERYPIDMTFFSTADHLEIGGVPFVVERDKPSRSEALVYYRRVARHFDLDVRQYERVIAAERTTDGFLVRTERLSGERRDYRAAVLVVATGYFDTPNPLGVPGEDLPHVTHYFREAHAYFDQRVLVVGGGNSAVEAALKTWRAGAAAVSLVHFSDRFDPGVKPWVRPDVDNRVQNGDIRAVWKHRIDRIEPGRTLVRPVDGGEERWLDADFVLAMTGFRPDTGLLLSLGVTVDPETGVPRHDPETMESDVPGVFIAGVLAAGFDANRIFIQNGREHGGRIVAHARRSVVDALPVRG